MSKPRLAIVGAGKVGSALGIVLQRCGYPMAGVASRTPASAGRLAARLGAPAFADAAELARRADLVLLTTPDGAVTAAAAAMAAAGGFRPGQVVGHTSGALSSAALAPARAAGAAVVAVHPLQTFAEAEAAAGRLQGSYFALEGDEPALAVARQLVADVGGQAFLVGAPDRPLYHAAAAIACSFLVALLHLATGLYARFGLSREEAFAALKPLVAGTFDSIAEVGVAPALTGPIARGDEATVRQHLAALQPFGAEVLDLYRRLGLYTVEVALEKGSIAEEQAARLREVLRGPA